MNPVINKYGTKYWYNEEERLHREDGPAIEFTSGETHWYIDGRLHRENGPAREWSDGSKEWYIDGLHHRLDGPAIEWSDGDKHWFYHGKRIKCSSQEEFERLIKLRMFW